MNPKALLTARIAVFEIGVAALVAVVALSIPKPRPVRGFGEIALGQQQPEQQRADYTPLALRAGTVVVVTGSLMAGLRARRARTSTYRRSGRNTEK